MLKICANLSKKVPLPNVDFSSQQFGASLEIEVSDSENPENIKAKLHQLYRLLSESVDEQIAKAATSTSKQVPVENEKPANRISNNAGSNGKRPPAPATEAQQRAIAAICKRQNIDVSGLLAEYRVKDCKELTVKEASSLIDRLKGQQQHSRN